MLSRMTTISFFPSLQISYPHDCSLICSLSVQLFIVQFFFSQLWRMVSPAKNIDCLFKKIPTKNHFFVNLFACWFVCLFICLFVCKNTIYVWKNFESEFLFNHQTLTYCVLLCMNTTICSFFSFTDMTEEDSRFRSDSPDSLSSMSPARSPFRKGIG